MFYRLFYLSNSPIVIDSCFSPGPLKRTVVPSKRDGFFVGGYGHGCDCGGNWGCSGFPGFYGYGGFPLFGGGFGGYPGFGFHGGFPYYF